MPRVVDRSDLEELLWSWELHLQSRNRSPKTIVSYKDAVTRLASYLRRSGLPTTIDTIDRRAVEGFIGDQLAVRAPATAAVRFRSLQQFFRWAADERLITVNPTDRMKPPTVPEKPVGVIPDADIHKLLGTCEHFGRPSSIHSALDFANVRDRAILWLFIDTPLRLSEMANIVVDGPEGSDLLLPEGVLRVLGKGAKTRYTAINVNAAKALDLYLKARARHDHAALPWLWLSDKGHLTNAGISQMLARRCKKAGIDHIHPHQFRHTFAHTWLQAGGNEGDLMEIAGWSSHEMLRRYAKSTASKRAQDAVRRLNVSSRLTRRWEHQ